ncbi:MAG TPA: EsaB/YukD family protein [Ruminococcus sp.]|nr:EsaB/YukD family protein [Ruminococcus sp.]
MKMIIASVSFVSEQGEKTYDLEMPCDVPVGILCTQISNAIRDYNGTPPPRCSTLHSTRLNRALGENETLSQAEIWSGDILLLK